MQQQTRLPGKMTCTCPALQAGHGKRGTGQHRFQEPRQQTTAQALRPRAHELTSQLAHSQSTLSTEGIIPDPTVGCYRSYALHGVKQSRMDGTPAQHQASRGDACNHMQHLEHTPRGRPLGPAAHFTAHSL